MMWTKFKKSYREFGIGCYPSLEFWIFTIFAVIIISFVPFVILHASNNYELHHQCVASYPRIQQVCEPANHGFAFVCQNITYQHCSQWVDK